ncbi:MAG: Dihydropteroate synthase [Phycisphaerae bacterium]|nr:Dihydropteroate synthase [Phycisphaerae bacterium]
MSQSMKISHSQPAPLIMGILNVTPDSFSDGGCFMDPPAALRHAEQLLVDGADIIDIGGESTRPSAIAIPPTEQIRRVLPVIEQIHHKHPDWPISIDTSSAPVAAAALAAGATIINDITALRADPAMSEVAAQAQRVVLMHMQGAPGDMQQHPHYEDVVAEIHDFLQARVDWAIARGIQREALIVDPGIGFGKTVTHNLQIIARLADFTDIAPVLLGVSRKSFIGKILHQDQPRDRQIGTLVCEMAALVAGVRIIRTHDVRSARMMRLMFDAIHHPDDDRY